MESLISLIISGDAAGVTGQIEKMIAEGVNAEKIIDEGLTKAMDELSVRMKNGELYVPEVLIAAEAMKKGLLLVKPLLKEEGYIVGKVVIGTVAGDLHDIGKNLVGMLLESSGFDVIDLGIDVSVESFVNAVEEHQPQIVGLSALLTTTMGEMEKTIKAVNGLDPRVKTMVGGAPVSQEFAELIGASGYAPNGTAAVDLAKMLLA